MNKFDNIVSNGDFKKDENLPQNMCFDYDRICFTYDELKKIIEDDNIELKTALSCVGGVYILTSISGHYVGVAYGEGGIWKQWSKHIAEKEKIGGKRLKRWHKIFPDAYKDFMYSILKIFPIDIDIDEANEWCKLYQERFFTQIGDCGFNEYTEPFFKGLP